MSWQQCFQRCPQVDGALFDGHHSTVAWPSPNSSGQAHLWPCRLLSLVDAKNAWQESHCAAFGCMPCSKYLCPVTSAVEGLQVMPHGTGMLTNGGLACALHHFILFLQHVCWALGLVPEACAHCAGGSQGQCQEQEGRICAPGPGPTLASAARPSQGPSQGASQVSLPC